MDKLKYCQALKLWKIIFIIADLMNSRLTFPASLSFISLFNLLIFSSIAVAEASIFHAYYYPILFASVLLMFILWANTALYKKNAQHLFLLLAVNLLLVICFLVSFLFVGNNSMNVPVQYALVSGFVALYAFKYSSSTKLILACTCIWLFVIFTTCAFTSFVSNPLIGIFSSYNAFSSFYLSLLTLYFALRARLLLLSKPVYGFNSFASLTQVFDLILLPLSYVYVAISSTSRTSIVYSLIILVFVLFPLLAIYLSCFLVTFCRKFALSFRALFASFILFVALAISSIAFGDSELINLGFYRLIANGISLADNNRSYVYSAYFDELSQNDFSFLFGLDSAKIISSSSLTGLHSSYLNIHSSVGLLGFVLILLLPFCLTMYMFFLSIMQSLKPLPGSMKKNNFDMENNRFWKTNFTLHLWCLTVFIFFLYLRIGTDSLYHFAYIMPIYLVFHFCASKVYKVKA